MCYGFSVHWKQNEKYYKDMKVYMKERNVRYSFSNSGPTCSWDYVNDRIEWPVRWNVWISKVDMGACGQVDRALGSISEGLGFDSHCWSCVEVPGKLLIPYCICPASSDGYLVEQKIGKS